MSVTATLPFFFFSSLNGNFMDAHVHHHVQDIGSLKEAEAKADGYSKLKDHETHGEWSEKQPNESGKYSLLEDEEQPVEDKLVFRVYFNEWWEKHIFETVWEVLQCKKKGPNSKTDYQTISMQYLVRDGSYNKKPEAFAVYKTIPKGFEPTSIVGAVLKFYEDKRSGRFLRKTNWDETCIIDVEKKIKALPLDEDARDIFSQEELEGSVDHVLVSKQVKDQYRGLLYGTDTDVKDDAKFNSKALWVKQDSKYVDNRHTNLPFGQPKIFEMEFGNTYREFPLERVIGELITHIQMMVLNIRVWRARK